MNCQEILTTALAKCGIDEASVPQLRTWAQELKENLEIVLQDSRAPLAVEAIWDGDSQGWFVVLVAVMSKSFLGEGPREHNVLSLRFGGDVRLFNNAVPPWPEAEAAIVIGNQLSQEWQVPFYFASPTEPNDDDARWGDSAAAKCRECSRLFSRPSMGRVCYRCSVKLSRIRHGR